MSAAMFSFAITGFTIALTGYGLLTNDTNLIVQVGIVGIVLQLQLIASLLGADY